MTNLSRRSDPLSSVLCSLLLLSLLTLAVALLSGCATARPTPAPQPASHFFDDVASNPPVPPTSRLDQSLSVVDRAVQIAGMAAGIWAWPLAVVEVGLGLTGTAGQAAQQWCASHPDHTGVWARIRCGAPAGETP